MKYDSVRDEILDAMTKAGWSNASSGDVESPTGWFARITIDSADIASVRDTFEGEFSHLVISSHWNDVIGHFLVREDSQGFVTVTQYPTEAELISAYDELDNAYGDWL